MAISDDGQVDAPARVALPVRLRVNDLEPITKNLGLLGPADVAGIEAAQVIRREPAEQSKSFAANYFPFIEFRSPDLPWLFTPLRPGGDNRLRPWLCLVVVRQQQGVTLSAGERGAPSRLRIDAPADAAKELPPLADSWAWAHCQVTRRADDTRPVGEILSRSPELVVSRLMCPRRLDPLASYHACVVPSFKAGVAAALGLPPVDTLAPAWEDEDPAVALPVYHSWEFSTGAAGDFEALARLLKPMPVPPGVGRREVDISDPHWADPADFGVPPDTQLTAQFEGALRPPDQDRSPLPEPVAQSYPQRIGEILAEAQTGGADDPDPIVAPPLYGRWHAGVTQVPDGNHWVSELNLDPRDRSAAGLGTQAVQLHQESLMHSAWTQVDGIVSANNLLNRGKVAEAVGTAFKARHINPMTAAEITAITFPVHAQLFASPVTIRETIAQSRLPDRAVSPTLRRALRKDGPLDRAVRRRDGLGVLPGMASGRLRAAEPHTGFAGTVTTATLADARATSPLDQKLKDLLAGRQVPLAAAALVLLVLALVLPFALTIAALILSALAGAAAAYAFASANRWTITDTLREGGPGPEALAAARPPQDFRVVLDQREDANGTPVPAEIATRRIEEFRAAAIARRSSVLAQVPEPLAEPPALSLPALRQTLLQRLDPTLLAHSRFADRIARPDPVASEDPLDPVMLYPEFDTPMYETLRDQNQDYVLPGLQNVPTNTVTVVETNRRFIEAFMVGTNHEMARELRWREYPTDQRGSYFRQFWDPRGGAGEASPAVIEARRDIRELTRWVADAPLGLAGLPEGREPEKLVLLVRGELLRRFPTAQLYAQKARFLPDGSRVLAEDIRHPVFRGALNPDVFFAGFDFDSEEAIGSTDPQAGRPGWFLVIQQQPTEPRFGLDVATVFAPDLPPLVRWDDLSWGHFAEDAQDFTALAHLSPRDAPATAGALGPDGIAWGRDGAAMAYATLQKPVRIAIHADDMLTTVTEDG